MNKNIQRILPPYLRQFGYCDVVAIQELSDKCFGGDKWNPWWVEVRGIFEYLACVEYSYQCINDLPKGIDLLYDFCEVKGKYHSATLVFFCQATLDTIAVFLKNKYSLRVGGANISLSKGIFQEALINKNSEYKKLFENHVDFLNKLNTYRMDWIHRIVGGSMIGGDKRPGDPDLTDENISLLIPMDSSFNIYSTDFDAMSAKIEKIKEKNNGKYLYSINEFSEYFLNETKNLVFDIVEMILPLFD